MVKRGTDSLGRGIYSLAILLGVAMILLLGRSEVEAAAQSKENKFILVNPTVYENLESDIGEFYDDGTYFFFDKFTDKEMGMMNYSFEMNDSNKQRPMKEQILLAFQEVEEHIHDINCVPLDGDIAGYKRYIVSWSTVEDNVEGEPNYRNLGIVVPIDGYLLCYAYYAPNELIWGDDVLEGLNSLILVDRREEEAKG